MSPSTPFKLEKLAKGYGLREADLPGALKNTDQPAPAAPAAGSAPSASGQPAPGGQTRPGRSAAGSTADAAAQNGSSVATGDMGGSSDEQLTQALDMLRGLAVYNRHASG